MRLCVPVPCFFKNIPFQDAIRRIKELGFDAAETYNWKSLDLDEVKKALDETGVELLSMCTTEFKLTDASYRQAWLDGLKESCVAANKLGVKKLITQVGQDTGAPREEQHANIVETLKLAKPILEEHKVTIMIEPLNTYVNHPGYYLWSAVEGFEIVREVDSPYVKVVYDIYHQQVMEGNIIHNVIFAAIDKAGYTGACGLEYGPLMPPEESLIIAKHIYG